MKQRGTLNIDDVTITYGTVKAVRSVKIEVDKGEAVAIFGTNGSGKTTLLKGIMGLIPIKSGKIWYNNNDETNSSAQDKIKKGIVYTPERAEVAKTLTVKENFILGGYILKGKKNLKGNLDYVYKLFPHLYDKKNVLAGNLSGGEKQMLVLGRALMSNPYLLLLDEPLLGLSPFMKKAVNELFLKLKENGITLLFSEHDIESSFEVLDRFYVIRNGEIKKSGKNDEPIEKIVRNLLYEV